MNGPLPQQRDRAQVGIGTLIVFIAMVLVAAIAAGVLINTAGFLQSQSEQTGQQSTSQVSDRLQVVNLVGEQIPAGDTRQIWVINITVKKAPGAEDIDLNTTTLQFVSDDEIVDLTHASRDRSSLSSGSSFNTTTIQDDDNSIRDSLVINSQEDRARIVLDIGEKGGSPSNNVTSLDANASDIGALDEGQKATIEITTPAGGETTVTLTVPDSLSGKSSVNL